MISRWRRQSYVYHLRENFKSFFGRLKCCWKASDAHKYILSASLFLFKLMKLVVVDSIKLIKHGCIFWDPKGYSSLQITLTIAHFIGIFQVSYLAFYPLISVVSHCNFGFSEMRRFYSTISKTLFNNRERKNKE